LTRTISDEFIADVFAARGIGFPGNAFMPRENGGVVWAQVLSNRYTMALQGDSWKAERRLTVQILRDFGMGKNIMEEQVQ